MPFSTILLFTHFTIKKFPWLRLSTIKWTRLNEITLNAISWFFYHSDTILTLPSNRCWYRYPMPNLPLNRCWYRYPIPTLLSNQCWYRYPMSTLPLNQYRYRVPSVTEFEKHCEGLFRKISVSNYINCEGPPPPFFSFWGIKLTIQCGNNVRKNVTPILWCIRSKKIKITSWITPNVFKHSMVH
jgi:hypothetical protein